MSSSNTRTPANTRPASGYSPPAIRGFAVGRAYLKVHPFMGVKYAAAFTSPDHEPRPAVTEPEAFGHLLRKMAFLNAATATSPASP